MSTSAFTLKVTLRHVRPPIWRRLRVPGSLSLAQLHDVVQVAFGWTDSHLHQFVVGRELFGMPDGEGWGGPPTRNEKKFLLEQIASAKTKFVYEYDFGDGWQHDIVVERVEPTSSADPVLSFACLDGRRACPPEDCGGPPGYENLCETLSDPKHPEYDEMREWVGPYWQPEAFAIDIVSNELRVLGARWNRRAATRRPKKSAHTKAAND